MLPLAKIDAGKARARPFMFVDSGVTQLLTTLFEMGAQRKNLVAKVAGAGSPLGKEETFRIGQRNCTMYLYMANGQVTVKSEGKEVPL